MYLIDNLTMPEFGTITVVVLAVAIIGIIVVTAKSRLTSNNVHMNTNDKTTMSSNLYKLAMVGILAIIVFGGYMAISGYNTDIYPLDRIRGNLDGIVSSSDPTVIRNHLVSIQNDLNLVMKNIPTQLTQVEKLFPKTLFGYLVPNLPISSEFKMT